MRSINSFSSHLDGDGRWRRQLVGHPSRSRCFCWCSFRPTRSLAAQKGCLSRQVVRLAVPCLCACDLSLFKWASDDGYVLRSAALSAVGKIRVVVRSCENKTRESARVAMWSASRIATPLVRLHGRPRRVGCARCRLLASGSFSRPAEVPWVQ